MNDKNIYQDTQSKGRRPPLFGGRPCVTMGELRRILDGQRAYQDTMIREGVWKMSISQSRALEGWVASQL